jgi:hypothetical protein
MNLFLTIIGRHKTCEGRPQMISHSTAPVNGNWILFCSDFNRMVMLNGISLRKDRLSDLVRLHMYCLGPGCFEVQGELARIHVLSLVCFLLWVHSRLHSDY